MQTEENKDILSPHLSEKYYNIRTIITACFFAGAIGSSYMIFRNFKTAGLQTKANWTIVIGLALIGLVVGSLFIESLAGIPNFVYSIFLTLLTALLANRFQGDLIKEKVSNGAEYFSSTNAVVVCIIGIILFVALMFGIAALYDSIYLDDTYAG